MTGSDQRCTWSSPLDGEEGNPPRHPTQREHRPIYGYIRQTLNRQELSVSPHTHFLRPFHDEHNGTVRISVTQASRFAKEIAGDFNPLHDPDSRRFCVPGDLLSALVFARYGISQQMECHFRGMVGEGASLVFPESPDAHIVVQDTHGKTYLEVIRQGPVLRDPVSIEYLIRAYVAFSGESFPHLLVPLMRQHGVMIHPSRPLVIYERMSLHLAELPTTPVTDALEPRIETTAMRVEGKRGEVDIRYALRWQGKPLATGNKQLVLSGLRPYEETTVQALVQEYARWKQSYTAHPVGGCP